MFINYISASVESYSLVVSNRALANNLYDFNEAERAGRHLRFPYEFRADAMVLNKQDLRIKNRFLDVFICGWENDTLSQFMPFNSLYLRHVLEPIAIYFTQLDAFDAAGRLRRGEPGGFYSVRWSRNVNFMHIGLMPGHQTTNLMLHEVGRALGLHDSLTVLFSEEFSGLRSSSRHIDGRAWGNYDPSFDRVLLGKAGPEAFWQAAFTSNKAYGRLWDKYLGDIVSFDVLMNARGVTRDVFRNDALMQKLQSSTGLLPGVLVELPNRFRNNIIVDTTREVSDVDAQRMEQFVVTLNILSDFALENNIRSYLSVLDYTIYGYIVRPLDLNGLFLIVISLTLSGYIMHIYFSMKRKVKRG